MLPFFSDIRHFCQEKTRKYLRVASTPSVQKKERLIILGSGWGSFKTAIRLSRSKYDICIVSPRNHFVFTPLLSSTTTGLLEFRSIVESVRSIPGVDFYQAYADDIDFTNKKVQCSEWDNSNRKFEVPYDKLVIGIGSDNNTFNIRGVNPSNVYFLKELRDSHAIRRKIIELLERASIPGISRQERQKLLHFIIVGGGPTGVEVAAELSDFFWSDVTYFYPNIRGNDIKVTLIEASDTILPSFKRQLVKKAIVSIRKQGVDIRLNTRVKEVKPGQVVLDDGTILDSEFVVWSTGVGPRVLVKKLGNELAPAGRLVTNGMLELKGHPGVYALGDCAQINDKPLPASAQVAQQQAKYLAKLLNGTLELDPTGKPVEFLYKPLGLMTYIGGSTSILDSDWIVGAGWIEFIAWRSVYLSKIGSWKNTLQVPFNWFKTAIWGRDITNF